MELWRQLTAISLPERNFGATNLKRAGLQSSRPCDREEKSNLSQGSNGNVGFRASASDRAGGTYRNIGGFFPRMSSAVAPAQQALRPRR
jgi:hypothetical protein